MRRKPKRWTRQAAENAVIAACGVVCGTVLCIAVGLTMVIERARDERCRG